MQQSTEKLQTIAEVMTDYARSLGILGVAVVYLASLDLQRVNELETAHSITQLTRTREAHQDTIDKYDTGANFLSLGHMKAATRLSRELEWGSNGFMRKGEIASNDEAVLLIPDGFGIESWILITAFSGTTTLAQQTEIAQHGASYYGDNYVKWPTEPVTNPTLTRSTKS